MLPDPPDGPGLILWFLAEVMLVPSGVITVVAYLFWALKWHRFVADAHQAGTNLLKDTSIRWARSPLRFVSRTVQNIAFVALTYLVVRLAEQLITVLSAARPQRAIERKPPIAEMLAQPWTTAAATAVATAVGLVGAAMLLNARTAGGANVLGFVLVPLLAPVALTFVAACVVQSQIGSDQVAWPFWIEAGLAFAWCYAFRLTATDWTDYFPPDHRGTPAGSKA